MKIETRDIFEQIGNAFYAVAKDQNLRASQRDELKTLVSGNWLPRNVSNDGVVSNEAQFILMTIDANEGQDLTAKDAFKEFSRFYHLHQDAFPAELRQKILDTAVEIADTFNEESGNEYILGGLNDLFYR